MFESAVHFQTKVVPPWVEEHPDVFSDPDFSITQLDTPTPSDTPPDLSFVSVGDNGGRGGEGRQDSEMESEVEKNVAWVSMDCSTFFSLVDH